MVKFCQKENKDVTSIFKISSDSAKILDSFSLYFKYSRIVSFLRAPSAKNIHSILIHGIVPHHKIPSVGMQ